VLLCETGNATIEGAPHDPEAVEDIDLRREDTYLVDVLHQTVVAVFAIDVIKESLARRLTARLPRSSSNESQRHQRATSHDEFPQVKCF
jgi:hypothetical protein